MPKSSMTKTESAGGNCSMHRLLMPELPRENTGHSTPQVECLSLSNLRCRLECGSIVKVSGVIDQARFSVFVENSSFVMLQLSAAATGHQQLSNLEMLLPV